MYTVNNQTTKMSPLSKQFVETNLKYVTGLFYTLNAKLLFSVFCKFYYIISFLQIFYCLYALCSRFNITIGRCATDEACFGLASLVDLREAGDERQYGCARQTARSWLSERRRHAHSAVGNSFRNAEERKGCHQRRMLVTHLLFIYLFKQRRNVDDFFTCPLPCTAAFLKHFWPRTPVLNLQQCPVPL